jgi:iron complex outermembrane receptor protein
LLTFRIYGSNITGKRYWAATGSSLVAQGMPATVNISLSTKL